MSWPPIRTVNSELRNSASAERLATSTWMAAALALVSAPNRHSNVRISSNATQLVAIIHRYDGSEDVDAFVQFATDALGLIVRIQPAQVLALDRMDEH